MIQSAPHEVQPPSPRAMPPPHPAARASRRASASAVQRCKPGPTRGTSRGRHGGVRARVGVPPPSLSGDDHRYTRHARSRPAASHGTARRRHAPAPSPGSRPVAFPPPTAVARERSRSTRLLRTSSWSRSTPSQRHRGENRKGGLRCELVGSVRARRWSERPAGRRGGDARVAATAT